MTRRPAALDPASPIATFASELRALRDRLGGDAPSVDEVSAATKIPRSTLYAALRGDRLPSPRVLAAIVRAWHGDGAEWQAKESAVEFLLSSGTSVAANVVYAQHRSPSVSWPVQVGAVPLLSSGYQIRDESALIDRISDSYAPLILQGLGGVGKSQLAAAYARSQADKVDLLLWINASSRPSIVAAYAEAASRLGYPASDNPLDAARWFLAWLQSNTKNPWLIILDDVSGPADLQGLWPDGSIGRTLVTTRRADATLTAGRTRIVVDSFSAEEAVAYLATVLAASPDDPIMDEADSLATDLGFLPLAMAQAAAFMLDRGESCSGYRRRLADRRLSLIELFPPDAMADDYRATLSASWSLSVQAADQLVPKNLSSSLLQVLSLLDSDGIPIDLIKSSTVSRYLQAQKLREGSHIVTAVDCQDALHNLARLSLVSLDNDTHSKRCRVHPLVQRSAIEQLSSAKLENLQHIVADALVEIWPDIERDAHLGQVLRANTAALALHAGASLWRPISHPVLWRAGYSMGESGLIDDAVAHWRWMTQEATQKLGPDHPDTLAARQNLASWRGRAGDFEGVALAFEQLLTDRVGVLGPDHPDTLTTRNNLASWRGQAGDAAGAAAAFEQLLADQMRVLGPDHPHTLNARNNLAFWRGQAGDAAGAAVAFEQLLADRMRVLGPDHPDTLTTRHNLAGWRGQAGDAAGAAVAFEQLLADRMRVLGPDHPGTLTTRNNLAGWRGQAGDAAGAAVAFEQLLADYLRVLVPDHPDTLTTRHNLAGWRGQAGDAAGAAVAFEQLLIDRMRVLGLDHPDTLVTRHNLAFWRGQTGFLGSRVRLIVNALAAGTISDSKNTMNQTIKGEYLSLKAAVAGRLRGQASTDFTLENYQMEPERWTSALEAELEAVGVAGDDQMVETAQRLLTVLEAKWRVGGYSIEVQSSQGVQIGDHNAQTNIFSSPPALPE